MENSEMFCERSTCCVESTGRSLDPLEVSGTIPAGCAQSEYFSTDCMLAKIYFPSQKYRAGYMPEEALCRGTMFPELVRTYK